MVEVVLLCDWLVSVVVDVNSEQQQLTNRLR